MSVIMEVGWHGFDHKKDVEKSPFFTGFPPDSYSLPLSSPLSLSSLSLCSVYISSVYIL